MLRLTNGHEHASKNETMRPQKIDTSKCLAHGGHRAWSVDGVEKKKGRSLMNAWAAHTQLFDTQAISTHRVEFAVSEQTIGDVLCKEAAGNNRQNKPPMTGIPTTSAKHSICIYRHIDQAPGETVPDQKFLR